MTWKYQIIDVIVVAQFKNVLYNLWSQWMLDAIEFGHFREASWNYIAPSRAKVIEWVLLAWEGPNSRVTEATILKGAKLCYMSQDLDESVKQWDSCKCDADYNIYDWKSEVSKLSEVQQRNLFVSPLAAEVDSEDE